MKLSILIPTTRRRRAYLAKLLDQFRDQLGNLIAGGGTGKINRIVFKEAEIIIDNCENCRVGDKRNNLLDLATGQYTCFVDDDDRIADNYIEMVMGGIATGADCLSLRGEMTINGNDPQIFEHSIRFQAYKTNEGAKYPELKYERFPNHLNVIKSEISKAFKFPSKDYGEDTAWATKIFQAGAIKTEHYIDQVIYYYDYRTK